MAEEGKKKSGWLRFWEFFQTLGFGALFLGVQHTLQETLMGVGKMAGETAGQKIKEAVGLSSEEAEKNDDDEISLRKVYLKGNLTSDEIRDIKVWIGRLRKTNPKLANEFTKRIHNSLVKSAKQSTIDSGTKEKPKKKTATDESEGIAIAASIIRDVLSADNDDARLEVLEQENIRVAPKKPAPAADAAKKAFEWSKEKAAEVADAEKVNRQDFNGTMASWREKSKAWRNSR